MEDLEKLKHLSKMVSSTSLCGLGQAAPDPLFSALRHFYDEFIDHIEHKTCRAGVCNMSDTRGGE